MAGHAGNLGMGRTLIGSVLRIHNRMTDNAAKIGGIGKVVSLIGHNDQHCDIDDRENYKYQNALSVILVGKINFHVVGIDQAVLEPFFPPEITGYRDKAQADHHHERQKEKGENGKIMVMDQPGEVADKTKDDQGYRNRGYRYAEETERGLASAAAYIRREMARHLHLKVAPELRFVYDDSTERGLRIEEVIESIGHKPEGPDH